MRVFEFEQFLTIIEKGGTLTDFVKKSKIPEKEVKDYIDKIIKVLEKKYGK